MNHDQDKLELFQALQIEEVSEMQQRHTLDWCCSFDYWYDKA